MKTLVVGCGSIGARHARLLVKLNGSANVGVFDLDKSRVEKFASEYSVSGYTNLEEALKDRYTEAIIAVPNNLHIPIAQKLAGHGLHLLIEKPLSASLDGIDELIKLCDERNLHVLVGYTMRFHPAIQKIKELISEKAVGEIYGIKAQFGYYLLNWHPWEDYRRGYSARKDLGGGVILDSSHELDYLSWIFGIPQEVFCYSDHYSKLEIDTEDLAEILLKYNGFITEVRLDYLNRTYRRTCEITGETGTITWDFTKNEIKIFNASNNEWRLIPFKFEIDDMYIRQLQQFEKHILGEKSDVPTAREAKRVLELALYAKESAKTGHPIKVG